MPSSPAAAEGTGAADSPITLVVVARMPPSAVARFRAYEDAVLPLLARHGGRLERRLRAVDDSAEVHVLSFTSAESSTGYRGYLADPDRASRHALVDGLDLAQFVLEVVDVQVPHRGAMTYAPATERRPRP